MSNMSDWVERECSRLAEEYAGPILTLAIDDPDNRVCARARRWKGLNEDVTGNDYSLDASQDQLTDDCWAMLADAVWQHDGVVAASLWAGDQCKRGRMLLAPMEAEPRSRWEAHFFCELMILYGVVEEVPDE